MSVKEILPPLTNFLKGRKTPFFTTYIYVWIIRNWEFILKFIYIDCPKELEHRIDLIKEYYPTNGDFICGIIINTILTLLFIGFTFFALSGARFLADLYQFNLVPRIRKLLDKIGTTWLLKEDIEPMRVEIEMLKKNLEEELEAKIKLQEQLKQQEIINHGYSDLLSKKEADIKSKTKKISEFNEKYQPEKELLITINDYTSEIIRLKDENKELKENIVKFSRFEAVEISDQIMNTQTGELLITYSNQKEPFTIEDYNSSPYQSLINFRLLKTESLKTHGKAILTGELTELGKLVINELESK